MEMIRGQQEIGRHLLIGLKTRKLTGREDLDFARRASSAQAIVTLRRMRRPHAARLLIPDDVAHRNEMMSPTGTGIMPPGVFDGDERLRWPV
jgi:hypothetical protein